MIKGYYDPKFQKIYDVFSDAVIFVVAVPNILGLYILAPVIKKELANYQGRLKSGDIKNYREI